MRTRLAVACLLVALVSFGLPAGPLGPILHPETGDQAIALSPAGSSIVSDPPGATQANDYSDIPSGYGITPDGRYIVFRSSASNLVGGDTNGTLDVFVYDSLNSTIELVSRDSSGNQANGPNFEPAISADGRYVAFTSYATNLVAGDTNNKPDVFVRDRQTNSTIRISVGPSGQGNGNSGGARPALSADGRYVAYESSATNLTSGSDTNNRQDIFLYDQQAGTNSLVSKLTSGAQTDGDSWNPAISADGRYIAFHSSARNLDVGGGNSFNDVFRRDMQTNTTLHVSTKADGSLATGAAEYPSISADGRYVSYRSSSLYLVPNDNSSNFDIFVKDTTTGSIQWASATPSGTPGSGASHTSALSSDGRYVAFQSASNNLVASDTNGRDDVFVHDLQTAGTELVSVGYQGGSGSGGSSTAPSITTGGRYVAFQSDATNIVQGDTNARTDVFLRDRGGSFAGVPIAQVIQCGEGPDARGASCQADPVNSLTGAFVNHATDLALPGIGLPFAFSRSYASSDPTEGALGRGWTHSYEAALSFEWDGDALLRNEIAQVVRFSKLADGTFKPDPANRSVLTTQGQDFVVTRRDQTKLTFNSSGKLTGIADRNGNDMGLGYTGGLLTTITDTAGRVITFTHNAQSRLSAISSPDGRTVGFAYTGGLLTSVTDVRGGTTTYAYDGSSRLTRVTDQNGHTVVENVYATNGRVTSQEDALGYTSTFSWDERLHTSTMTDARGKQWKDKYSNNLLVRQTDPVGNVTTFTHDEDGNVASATDPRNNTTTTTYGARGNLLTRTAPAPLSFQEVFTYNSQNSPLTYQDGRGNTTSFEYDARGNLIKITQPGSMITQLGRDATTGQLTSVTDPRGKTTSFVYDSSGNLDEVTTPLGNKTTFTQDASGRVTQMVEPRGNVAGASPTDYAWQFTYDAAGNLRTRTDPLGYVTEWTYDPAGNVTSVKDANNHTISYSYNAADELTTVSAPGAIDTGYAYDQSGNLTSRTDDNNHTTAYEYDDAGRLAAVQDPLGNRWTYGYDAAGNLSTVIDTEGNFTPASGDGTTTLSFDAMNRPTAADYSGSTPDLTWTYDGNSNPTQMTDGLGTETYAYDALNRLSPVTRGSDSFAYVYDSAGNVTKRTYPDGTVVDLAYDDDGRLSSVTSAGKTTSYTYDPAGNVTKVTYPNGTEETRIYDRAGRVTEVTHKKGPDVLARFTYTLDPVGNPTRVDGPSETITYQYDALDRLAEACYQVSCTLPVDPFIRYTYDGVGNRLTEVRPTGTTTYTYDVADRLLSAASLLGTTAFTYDRNGNQTSAGTRSFSWNQRGLLVSTSQGTDTTVYDYDGLGKRLRATRGSDVTNFTWDVARPLPELVLERDGSGGLKRRYLYGRDLLQMTTGGSDYVNHHDALGSVAAITSGTGAKIASYLYEPYGSERTFIPPNPSTPENPMRFTGEYLDPTGLYHLRARQYDSATGRFSSLDPAPAALGAPCASSYLYASARPSALVDPSGARGERIDAYPASSVTPSCRAAVFTGNVGSIGFQTSPGGYVQWGIYMHSLAFQFGFWNVDVLVNGTRVDAKWQPYPPHGAISPRDAPPGSIVSIKATWTFLFGLISAHSVPNACVVPVSV